MIYDAIIIGGSFAGLSAAIHLARVRKSVLMIDAARPRNRFSHASHGFLGQDGVAPANIMAIGKQQLAQYPSVELVDGDAVTAAGELGVGFTVTLADGRSERGTRVVLSTGVADELPKITGIEERWGKTVIHCPYCHGYEVSGRRLGVIADHVLSAHQAFLLPDLGPTIYFDQGGFAPDEATRAQFAGRGIAVESNAVVELLGQVPELEAVRLADGRIIPMGAVFVSPRTRLASPFAEQLGCDLEQGPLGPYVKADETRQTSVPGVWVAGDAGAMFGNATLASAHGVIAGTAVHRSLAVPSYGAQSPQPRPGVEA